MWWVFFLIGFGLALLMEGHFLKKISTEERDRHIGWLKWAGLGALVVFLLHYLSDDDSQET